MMENNGIKYFTIINPLNKVTVKSLQNQYITEYNISLHVFLIELNKIVEDTIKNEGKSFTIDCSNDNDEINTNSNYEIKFLRSVFLKDKLKDIYSMFNFTYEKYFFSGPKVNPLENTYTFYIKELI